MAGVSDDSVDYDFNIRLICFVGLAVGTSVLSLMCLCRTYDWCKARGYRDIYDSIDQQTETSEDVEADVTSPLITSTASQETTQYYSTLQNSTHYFTAIQETSSCSSSSERESIVIINANDTE